MNHEPTHQPLVILSHSESFSFHSHSRAPAANTPFTSCTSSSSARSKATRLNGDRRGEVSAVRSSSCGTRAAARMEAIAEIILSSGEKLLMNWKTYSTSIPCQYLQQSFTFTAGKELFKVVGPAPKDVLHESSTERKAASK